MIAAASRPSGALADWLETEGLGAEPGAGPGAIADVAAVRAMLLDAARAQRALSYSEALGLLGQRFTRPKMRALCRTLDAIDAERRAEGRAELAVLVVREGDRLPGQGWWTDAAARRGHRGGWVGPEAAALVRRLQDAAFADVADADQKRRAKPA